MTKRQPQAGPDTLHPQKRETTVLATGLARRIEDCMRGPAERSNWTEVAIRFIDRNDLA
jgi:hypothetical protein